MAILEVFALTTFIPSDEFVGLGPLWGALTCWCLPLRVLMPKLCSWEHQEGTRWQEVQPCFNIATGVVFGCVSFGKIFWDHCALLNLALQHRKDSILTVQSFFSRPFLYILFGALCNYAPWKNPSDTKGHIHYRKWIPKRLHLKRTIVFWPPFCMPEICPPSGNLPWGLARIGNKCRQSVRKVGHYYKSVLSYNTPLMVIHTFLELLSTWEILPKDNLGCWVTSEITPLWPTLGVSKTSQEF